MYMLMASTQTIGNRNQAKPDRKGELRIAGFIFKKIVVDSILMVSTLIKIMM